jgi:hypothetical protein
MPQDIPHAAVSVRTHGRCRGSIFIEVKIAAGRGGHVVIAWSFDNRRRHCRRAVIAIIVVVSPPLVVRSQMGLMTEKIRPSRPVDTLALTGEVTRKSPTPM